MDRALLPLALLVAAGCAAETGTETTLPGAARLPESLRILTLNEDHPTATPVVFDHAFHASPRLSGATSCAACHHETRFDAAAVPRPCGACHPHNYMAPEHDESQPHDHAGPPDL